jgi:hypothetical protein
VGILSDDETAMVAAAQAQAHGEDSRWRGTASQTPGIGWAPVLPQPPSSAGGFQVLPVIGENFGPDAAPGEQPRQVKAQGGQLVRPAPAPVYGGSEIAGSHYSYGPTAPAPQVQMMVMTGRSAPGPAVEVISPDTPRSLWRRLFGRR